VAPLANYAVKAAWCICSVKSCVIHAERFRSGVIHLRRYTNGIYLYRRPALIELILPLTVCRCLSSFSVLLIIIVLSFSLITFYALHQQARYQDVNVEAEICRYSADFSPSCKFLVVIQQRMFDNGVIIYCRQRPMLQYI